MDDLSTVFRTSALRTTHAARVGSQRVALSVLLVSGIAGAVSAEGEEPTLTYAVKTVGAEPFVFSSDFPHEVNAEMCKHEMEELLETDELSQTDKEAIFATNAARFYRLP